MFLKLAYLILFFSYHQMSALWAGSCCSSGALMPGLILNGANNQVSLLLDHGDYWAQADEQGRWIKEHRERSEQKFTMLYLRRWDQHWQFGIQLPSWTHHRLNGEEQRGISDGQLFGAYEWQGTERQHFAYHTWHLPLGKQQNTEWSSFGKKHWGWSAGILNRWFFFPWTLSFAPQITYYAPKKYQSQDMTYREFPGIQLQSLLALQLDQWSWLPQGTSLGGSLAWLWEQPTEQRWSDGEKVQSASKELLSTAFFCSYHFLSDQSFTLRYQDDTLANRAQLVPLKKIATLQWSYWFQ